MCGFIHTIADCMAESGCASVAGVNRFAELNEVEVEHVKSGGERKSKHSEHWACKAFDEWRLCKGYSIGKSVGDLSEEEDLHPFVDMLLKFFLQVRKMDGNLYPPNS
jgi:hypothetical protein